MTDGAVAVTWPDIPVLYAAGDRARPVPEQAPEAFRRLDAAIGVLTGRRFYGVVVEGAYRACVAREPGDPPTGGPAGLPTWTIPGGRYAGWQITNWQLRLPEVRATMATLRRRPDRDAARPSLTHHEDPSLLLVLVPVVSQ